MKKIVLAAAALAVGFGVSSAFAEDAAKPEAKPAKPVMHHHHHMTHHHHYHHHHHTTKTKKTTEEKKS